MPFAPNLRLQKLKGSTARRTSIRHVFHNHSDILLRYNAESSEKSKPFFCALRQPAKKVAPEKRLAATRMKHDLQPAQNDFRQFLAGCLVSACLPAGYGLPEGRK